MSRTQNKGTEPCPLILPKQVPLGAEGALKVTSNPSRQNIATCPTLSKAISNPVPHLGQALDVRLEHGPVSGVPLGKRVAGREPPPQTGGLHRVALMQTRRGDLQSARPPAGPNTVYFHEGLRGRALVWSPGEPGWAVQMWEGSSAP